MKKLAGLGLIIVVMFIMSSTTVAADQKSFRDVSDSYWAKESIDYLTDRQIIFGYPDGRFGIHDPITRAQAATMIMRYFGWGDLSGQEDPGYPDLSPSHWAYDEIATVYALGIFTPEGNFQPDLPVTRGEMADMLVKTFDLSSITAVKFTDMSRDHWAYQSVNTLAGKGVAKGYPDGTFRPDANVTRAEFASLMSTLMKEEYASVRPGFEGAIYDLEIGGHIYQLEHPLLLTDRWLAPVELFEKMGYYVQSHDKNELTIMTVDGREIHLYEGQQEVWVGATSVQIDHPLVIIEEQPYIAASDILRVLEKPLVFYPDQFLIRLEAPRITVNDINRELPEAAIDVIHPKQPYWHWAKRDRDYLELTRRGDLSEQTVKLMHEEMKLLTDAYISTEKEKLVIRGANYFSDSVTGKLDAISRGIEARYRLLYDSSEYAYPAVGKSGALGVFRSPYYEFDYLVADHHYEHYIENKQRLIDEVTNNTDLPIENFQGLNIHGIPFYIRERLEDGSTQTWSGLASGSDSMLVVNSGVGTFVHEFGHNWDYKYGDDEAYLKLRGKEGYVPQSSEWADRVGENFAEDFAAAFLSGTSGYYHKATFGQPSEELLENMRRFVQERTPATVTDSTEELIMNGISLLPTVMHVSDGQLRVQGYTQYDLYGIIENMTTGEESLITLIENGGSYDQVIQLPEPGHYEVMIGGRRITVVYP